jgi:SEC-C motif-containing protein
MRSRYAAYVKHEIDFILRTCTGDRAAGIDEKRTRDWSEKSQWLGLAIHSVSGGGSADSEGSVEFTAFYTAKGLRDSHHELARFKKINGQWLYDEGEIVPATVVRDGPRVGRNDPCPCGSGKKYKLCHGR